MRSPVSLAGTLSARLSDRGPITLFLESEATFKNSIFFALVVEPIRGPNKAVRFGRDSWASDAFEKDRGLLCRDRLGGGSGIMAELATEKERAEEAFEKDRRLLFCGRLRSGCANIAELATENERAEELAALLIRLE